MPLSTAKNPESSKMAVNKSDPKNNLIKEFPQGSVDTLWKKMRREVWKASKLYSSIDTAIWALPDASILAQDPKWSEPPDKKLIKEGGSTDPTVDDLKEILGYAEKDCPHTKKFDLFLEAIGDLSDLPSDTPAEKRTMENMKAYITVQALCKIKPTIAFDAEKGKLSAFQRAAQSGTDLLMQVMIIELECFLERRNMETSRDELLKFMSGKDKEQSACRMAVDGLRIKVLRVLARNYPSLVDDGCVTSAIEKTAKAPLEDRKEALEAFQLVYEARGTRDSGKLWEKAVKTQSLAVVDFLLNKTGTDAFATDENAELLIKTGTKEMWRMFSKDSRDKFMSKPGCKLLHTAVSSRKADIVDEILSEYPEQINAGSALDGNTHHPVKLLDHRDTSIRNRLVHAMIKSRKLEIREIKGILKLANVEGIHGTQNFESSLVVANVLPQAYPMGLSFPRIHTPEDSFADYVEWLTKQSSSAESIYKFETILKHVTFPDLSREGPPQNSQEWQMNHTEIKDVFKWLYDRGVRTVLDLTVYDRLHRPHSDDDVAFCVNSFGIRVLKWRKPDLYLGNLNPMDKEQMAQLEELYLYSSGKRAVHNDWYNELPRFPNLKKLHVHVIEDLTGDRLQTVKDELQGRLNDINESKKVNYRWDSSLSRDSGVPNGDEKLVLNVTPCKWAREQGEDVPVDINDTAFEVVGPNLDKFLYKFREHWVKPKNRSCLKTVKVAIIDSGVVVFDGKSKTQELQPSSTWGNYLKYRVVDGISLVSRDTEDEVFWHASEPHGTQMAKLICSIYPLCALYVVKVTETRGSHVTANNVADAINWAVEKDVDVISLSLATYGDYEAKLTQALRSAKDKDIVIVSSTADTGMKMSNPVAGQEGSKKDVFSIAACNGNGHLLPQSEQVRFDFCFLGHVRIDPVPTLKSKKRIEGSSVATAIAAGTAALTLACCHIAKNCPTDGSGGNWRCRMVDATFKNMARGNAHNVPWVDLERFCSQGHKEELSEGKFDFKELVNKNFIY